MTANRWWVRLAARWLARVDGVTGQLRLAMLSLTGYSTMSLSLQQYGYGHLALPAVSVSLLGIVVYTYYYTEGGVWNQMARDRQDMSGNFSSANHQIAAMMYARSLAAASKGRALEEDERRAAEEEAELVFERYRDGVDIAED